jgi:hypothetical protein
MRGCLARLVIVAAVLVTVVSVEAQHPQPPTGFEAALIGLLELPLIYDALESADPKPATPSRIDVRRTPADTAPIAATLDKNGITRADGARCSWHREPQCLHHEVGYEVPALAVFENRQGAWYRIAIDREGSQFGWIRSTEKLHRLEALALGQERLTYLTAAWRGALYDRPGGVNQFTVPRTPQTPYRPLRPVVIGGRLWIEVAVLAGACTGGPDDDRVVGKGWVPVRDAVGELNVWYWSRGC